MRFVYFSDCIYTHKVLWLEGRKVLDIIEINKLGHCEMSMVCACAHVYLSVCVCLCVYLCICVCTLVFMCTVHLSVCHCVCVCVSLHVCLRKRALCLHKYLTIQNVWLFSLSCLFFPHATRLPPSPTGIPLLGNLCPYPLKIAGVKERFLQHIMQSIKKFL